MSPMMLGLAVAAAFGAIALLMLALPRWNKLRHKRHRRWNHRRPKHDLSPRAEEHQPD